jgi:Tfp pilus assembly protein PilV
MRSRRPEPAPPRRLEEGVSLVEVLVALLLLSVGLVGPDSHLVNTYGVWCGAAAGPLPCAALRVS